MNHLQFRTSLGVVGVTWNSQSRISRLDWYSLTPSTDPQISRKWSLLAKQASPAILGCLFESLFEYLECGKPMEQIPWEQIDQTGWTLFQAAVYQKAAQIPFGETRTYSWLATAIGKPSATRAVGQALRKNPLPILIPCHRVTGTHDLGGFMGAQSESAPEMILKQRLLALESEYLNPVFSFVHRGPSHRPLHGNTETNHRLNTR